MVKKAFTLAEVLITLTIIGVIAAITIPNLMQSYKKHQVEVAVKEAYSILSNALAMARSETSISWTEMIDESFAFAKSGTGRTNHFSETYVVPYLKTVKTCRTGNCDIITYDRWVDYNGNEITGKRAIQDWYKIKLNNGMNIGIYIDFQSVGGRDANFIVDIDGNKGANQFGKDIFVFRLVNDNYGTCTGANPNPANCILKETFFAGGDVYTYRNNLEYCLKAGSWAMVCSAAIAKNGWKVPNGYPVKKW